MKIVCWSDRHSRNIELPKGDIFLFAGDMTNTGNYFELVEFYKWFGELDYKWKICIAGNHDRGLEYDRYNMELLFHFHKKNHRAFYLNDEELEIEGLKIYGSPVTPICFDWAFSMNDIQRELYWEKIKKIKPDIVLTHSPCWGILDHNYEYGQEKFGCQFLRKIIEKVRPKLHVCGHIHEAAGQTSMRKIVESRGGKWEGQDTIFVNAFEPVVIEL